MKRYLLFALAVVALIVFSRLNRQSLQQPPGMIVEGSEGKVFIPDDGEVVLKDGTKLRVKRVGP